MPRRPGSLRIAAVGDTHCRKTSHGTFQRLFSAMAQEADVLCLCGDLTDFGLPDEARVLDQKLGAAGKAPVVAVLGNHDYQSGTEENVRSVLTEAGVRVLDGDSWEIDNLGFVGVNGFFGGFGERMLQAWGEEITKRILPEAMEETLKLESALAPGRDPESPLCRGTLLSKIQHLSDLRRGYLDARLRPFGKIAAVQVEEEERGPAPEAG